MISDKFITPQNKAAFLQALASTDAFNDAELALLKDRVRQALLHRPDDSPGEGEHL